MRPYPDIDTPRIYVACLASYNAGTLHGRWIDPAHEVEDIWREVRDMLASSPAEGAEEWAIHDFEGFGHVPLSEWEGIERVHELAVFIAENARFGSELLAHFCGDLEESRNALDNYIGEFASLEDYALHVTEETTEIPEGLRHYIDYAAMARDIEINGDVFAIETGLEQTHVFLNT